PAARQTVSDSRKPSRHHLSARMDQLSSSTTGTAPAPHSQRAKVAWRAGTPGARAEPAVPSPNHCRSPTPSLALHPWLSTDSRQGVTPVVLEYSERLEASRSQRALSATVPTSSQHRSIEPDT